MAFYTVFVTLMQDLEQLLSSYDYLFASSSNLFTKEEMEILYKTVCLTDSLLRNSSGQSYDRGMMDQILEKRVSDVAHKAGNCVNVLVERCLPGRSQIARIIVVEDENLRGLISSYAKGKGANTTPNSEDPSLSKITTPNSEDPSLSKITGEFLSVNEELKKIRGNRKAEVVEIASSTEGKLSTTLMPLRRRALNAEGKLVGLEKDLVTMLDSLTGHPSQLKALPIVGMAGIGKTTFAKRLYDDPLVLHHFFIRAWVTVSQQYQVRDMLLGVLHCVTTVVSDEICERSNEDLREQVYKILKGNRYLIVLDDMWDTRAWDDLNRIFPDDKNGSRIMLTSRLREVAVHASQDTSPHCLRCLSMEESWELLSAKIFGDGSCPLELVDIGKHIAYKCQGLPLALVVIGGILSKMNKKIEAWEEVAQSVCSLVMEEAEHCLNILALSYNHLPDYLKPCFLYMGIFPEDHEISVKRLILLWVAEGFIMPNTLKSLEEVAMDYLLDLITRSLIQVKTASSDGRIKSCSIHDMTRELCLRESKNHNFFHVINRSGRAARNPKRFSFHSATSEYIYNATPYIHCRSFICFEKLSISSRRIQFGFFRLLKVLDIMNIYMSNILEGIKYLCLLKFLAITINDSSSITKCFMFHSLQTVIVDCEWDGHLPMMFWYMPELRHLQLKRSCLSYSQSYYTFMGFRIPSTPDLEQRLPLRVLTNLRSMSTIRPISCTKKIFLSMPHLKKLGIYETEDDHAFRGWFANLVHLKELEKLKYVFCNPFVSSRSKPDRLPSWSIFPRKLVKLTLSGTSFPWEDMLKLSMLPNLEVLKLRNYAFCGAVWRSQEGGFHCLRFLSIGSTNLEIWEAEGTHFPKLEQLVLRHCRSLREIPYGIGDAPLLENIELRCCKDSAAVSARILLEEQQSFGNDGLTLRIIEG